MEYKGFKITVHAAKHPSRTAWIPSGVAVIAPTGNSIQTFCWRDGDATYPTREEAISAGHEIVKRQIDLDEI
jgi:hypothetical protein